MPYRFVKTALPKASRIPRKRFVIRLIRSLKRRGTTSKVNLTKIMAQVAEAMTGGSPDRVSEAATSVLGKKALGEALKRVKKFKKHGSEQKSRDRTIGQGVGSAASNFVTGYAAAPLLYPNKDPFRKVKPEALKGLLKAEEVAKIKEQAGHGWLRRTYGLRALKPAIALTGAALVGGALRQHVSEKYEAAAAKRRKTAGVLGGFSKKAAALVLYTRNPSERPTYDAPKPNAGFAAAFGSRYNASRSHFNHASKGSEEWMGANSEIVDLGNRPNMVAATREVLGIEPGKPISRAEVLRIVNERAAHANQAVTRRRMAVLRGTPEAGADSTQDVREMIDALGTVVKHPRVHFVELQERS